jgi:hypothetical protein
VAVGIEAEFLAFDVEAHVVGLVRIGLRAQQLAYSFLALARSVTG